MTTPSSALRTRTRACASGCVLLFLLVTSVVVAPAAGATTAGADGALDAAIDRLVSQADGPPGIAVVVQRGAVAVLHSAGTAVVGEDSPIGSSDHLRLASVAKAFSGAVASSVVASGAMTLDDTIGMRLPTLPAAWGSVTLRQLLQHTSGIPDFSKSKAFHDAFVASLQVPPPPAQLLSYVASDPLLFAPGTRYQYSNSDNIVVGLMVEAVTGQRYEDELQQRVFGPLGLSETSLPAGSAMPAPTARGYGLDPPNPPEDVTTAFAAGWTWASGGIVSTPADANRFARGYASGAVTDAATHRAQLSFVPGSSEPPGPGRNAAGLAIFRYRTSCGTVYGHTGNTGGYTQFLASTADGRRSVSVSVNAQVTPSSNARRFRDLRAIYALAVCAAFA